jgi:hypothetical protein
MDKTLGLVGFGDIAQEVARRARCFGMKIIWTKRMPLSLEEKNRYGVSTAIALLHQSCLPDHRRPARNLALHKRGEFVRSRYKRFRAVRRKAFFYIGRCQRFY